ncbi:hypothetical protein QR680_017702 [Steinernema hermaphroditum]|uniref:1-Cys peroxiredoxin n=1 Tax=Steinernema hermaphroditum TaxID=289476 RepID=A0AA39HHK1_9BILA|nr:hypothetical protein QR680_017702 [Steinernema hermaphroditum]
MTILLGSVFPDFSAETNAGQIESFHEWIGSSWAILFSHPNDFTPVCTTELARAAELNDEFKKRDVKLIALSCDNAESHRQWIPDIIEYCQKNKTAEECGEGDAKKCCSNGFPFPIIADENRVLANKLGMLDPDEKDASGSPVTARAVFVIDPSKRMKLKILYPATTGRNFDEILRVVDSLQLTAAKKVATPVDWKQGDKCMVIPTLSEDEAAKLFGDQIEAVELPSGKKYIRKTQVD